MFRKRSSHEPETEGAQEGDMPDEQPESGPAADAPREPGAADSGRPPGARAPAGPAPVPPTRVAPVAGRPDIPRRPHERAAGGDRPTGGGQEESRLTVGRDIRLAGGEISSCETLVVEGHIEVSLSDARLVQIAEGGVFKGSAEIDNADISGLFEGTLTVRDRLLVRAAGEVRGTVRYGRLEVECGGRLTGDVGVNDSPDQD